MRILGLISGTSHDGIDAVLAEFEVDGEDLKAKVLSVKSVSYKTALRTRLLSALPPNTTDLEEICRLDSEIGQAFGELAKDVLGSESADLVVSHGQTVYHWVDDGKALGTLQLGQSAWIAKATGAPVLSDLRIADIAQGGQGAPIVPILDLLTLGSEAGCVGSLNLGGIANVTIIKNGNLITAYDTGPASALIDAAVIKFGLNPEGFDRDGTLASSGEVIPELLDSLLSESYYKLPAPKSTGKELFHVDYLEQHLASLNLVPRDVDVIATLTDLTAETVARELLLNKVQHLVVGGGGVNNSHLMSLIERKTNLTAVPFGEYGIAGDFKEAMAMALIGWLSIHNLPATFASTTGANQQAVLGSLAAGDKGFPQLPKPQPMPKRLVISDAK